MSSAIYDLWRPVAAHLLVIVVTILPRKNFIGWHMNSKQEPIS